MALIEQLVPYTKKNPEKLTGDQLVEFLIRNPEAKGNFCFSRLKSPAWCRLLTHRPDFIDRCDTAKITPDCASKIIIAQPQLLPYFSPDRIDWRDVLSERPELIDKMPKYRRLARSSWAWILRCQPGLWNHSPKNFTSEEWSEIIDFQPQLADKCPWREVYFSAHYSSWKKCLFKYPDLILGRRPDWKQYYNLDNLGSRELTDLLCCNPEIEKLVDFSVFGPSEWKKILEKQPQFIKYCDVKKIFSGIPFSLIAARPELEKCFDLQKSCVREIDLWFISLRGIADFVESHPQLAEKVLNCLRQERWVTLLHDHPEYLLKREGWKYSFRENTQAFAAVDFWDFERTGLDSICNNTYKLLQKSSVSLTTGLFCDSWRNQMSPGEFLMKRVMDPVNAECYFLSMLRDGKKNFIMGILDFDPDALSDLIKTKDIPFFLSAAAPEQILEQLLVSVPDLIACRDRNGNTLLHAALVRAAFDDVRSLLNTDNPYRERYDDLLIAGCDPDQKNKFGFSCNDLIEQIKRFTDRKG